MEAHRQIYLKMLRRILNEHMKQLGQESADLQNQWKKELADIKAQGSCSNIMKKLFSGRNRASSLEGIPLPDGQDNGQDKKKDSSTGDLGDDTDSKSPMPQKKIDDGSGNVYSQPYTQNFDSDDKSFEQVSKDDSIIDLSTVSKPSGERFWGSQDDSTVGLSTVSKPSGERFRGSQDDSRIAPLKERDMLQLADVMHRAKLFLSKKEMARENNQISLMVQNLRQYQEAYSKGEEVSMDHFHTAIRELNECLQERERGGFRENIEKKHEPQKQLRANIELQQKPNGPSGTVGEKIEQKIKKSEKGGSRGKSS